MRDILCHPPLQPPVAYVAQELCWVPEMEGQPGQPPAPAAARDAQRAHARAHAGPAEAVGAPHVQPHAAAEARGAPPVLGAWAALTAFLTRLVPGLTVQPQDPRGDPQVGTSPIFYL